MLPGNRELKYVRTEDQALVLKQNKQKLWMWDACIPPVFKSPEGLIKAPMAERMPVSNSWFYIWIWKVPHRLLAWTLGPSPLWWLRDGVFLEDVGPKRCLFLSYFLACFCFLVLWYGQLLSATSSCRHGVLFQHVGLSKCRLNPMKPWAKINNSFPKFANVTTAVGLNWASEMWLRWGPGTTRWETLWRQRLSSSLSVSSCQRSKWGTSLFCTGHWLRTPYLLWTTTTKKIREAYETPETIKPPSLIPGPMVPHTSVFWASS